MENEYRIEICMTPRPEDNKSKPYFWAIFEDRCNAYFGWSETPEKAWDDAMKYYTKHCVKQK